jgi:serine/threonine-protein kinase
MNVSLLSTSADVSRDREGDHLLVRRARVTFGLGLAAAASLLAVGEVHSLFAGGPPPAASERWVYAAYVAVFGIGFFGSRPRETHPDRIRWLTLLVTAGLLFVLALDTVLHLPDYPPLALVALILFGAAALLPWPVPFQVGLVASALAAVPTIRVLLGRGVGDPGWWSWPVLQSDAASGAIFGFVGVTLLGGVSIAITRTLYHLRIRALVAERMGGYRLVKQLGKGGGGSVYMAEHCRMCRPSAVKIIRASPARDPTLIFRFEREIEMASRLDHPNTIEIRDYGRADESTFFLAMEYLVGLDLQELVRRHGPVRPERAVHILLQVCDSLAEAHDKGIVHRDLKPANVFITRRGGICDFVKVLDFGLAKQVNPAGDETITGAGAIVGTPHYMAPEAVGGAELFEPRSDVYSLGCTAYWMLAGRPPYEGSTAAEVMAAHVLREPVPIDAASELDVPPLLAESVMRCMSKAAADRFDDVPQLRDTLASIEFRDPWTAASARAWWDLHLPERDPSDRVSRPRGAPSSP